MLGSDICSRAMTALMRGGMFLLAGKVIGVSLLGGVS